MRIQAAGGSSGWLPKCRLTGVVLAVGLAWCAASPDAAAADQDPTGRTAVPRGEQLPVLEREIARLADVDEGTVGVGAVHVPTGRSVYVNGTERFYMASTRKVPIAVQLLTLVDEGRIALDSLVEVRAGALHPGSGVLADLFDDPGLSLSMKNLLDLMLIISDNSAADLILEAVGGPDSVTARLRRAGLDATRVDRATVEAIADYVGIENLPPPQTVSPERFRQLSEAVSPEQREAARAAYEADPRDTTTPDGMVRLLTAILQNELLSPTSSALLVDVMYRCRTGEERLKGFLPPGTRVAHKTGTIGRTTNDVGIIELPGDAGHVVAAVFIKESALTVAERERVIAQIGRALYDYFLFHPVEGTS